MTCISLSPSFFLFLFFCFVITMNLGGGEHTLVIIIALICGFQRKLAASAESALAGSGACAARLGCSSCAADHLLPLSSLALNFTRWAPWAVFLAFSSSSQCIIILVVLILWSLLLNHNFWGENFFLKCIICLYMCVCVCVLWWRNIRFFLKYIHIFCHTPSSVVVGQE